MLKVVVESRLIAIIDANHNKKYQKKIAKRDINS